MHQKLKPTILAALVLAFSMFGDTFLYAVLPTNAAQLNVPIVWIGFLLSINRFIRLVFNQWFALLFSKYGFRHITILAASLSVISTFMYGIASGVFIWIVARIFWALSYSALRISSINYSLDAPKQGFGLGLSRGLQETGPLLALPFGSLLLQWTNPQTTFIVLAIASVSSVVIAFYLPELKIEKTNQSFHFNFIPSTFNFLVFVSALLIEGMLVVMLGKLFSGNQLSILEITKLSASYLAFRRICIIIISPPAGLLADRWDIEKVFLSAIVLSISALLFIAFDFTKTGIVLAFIANSISSALAPAASLTETGNRLKEVAANTTWRDFGAALGALGGGFLISFHNTILVFFIATFILSMALVIHQIKTKIILTKNISWK